MHLNRRKSLITLVITSFLGIMATQTAIASSIFVQVQPNAPVQKGLQFNVQRQVGQNPKVSRFIVEIIPTTGQLPPQSKATLSVLKTAINGFQVETFRDVDCNSSEMKMICRFGILNQDLKKDLAFVFAVPIIQPGQNQTLEMLPDNVMYFKLKPIALTP